MFAEQCDKENTIDMDGKRTLLYGNYVDLVGDSDTVTNSKLKLRNRRRKFRRRRKKKSKFFKGNQNQTDVELKEISIEEDENINTASVDNPDEKDFNTIGINLLQDVKNIKTFYFFVGAEGARNFKTYIRATIIILGIAYLGFIGFTFLSLFLPGLILLSSTTSVIILFVISEAIWIFQKIFINGDGDLQKLLKWIIMIIVISIYYAMVLLLTLNLNWVSVLIIHIITIIVSFGFIALVYFTKEQFEEVRELSPLFDTTYTFLSVFVIYLAFSFFSSFPGLTPWIFLVAWVREIFQFFDEVVEMFEGATGVYDQLEISVIMFALVRLMLAQIGIIAVIFTVLKDNGLTFIFPLFWPPFFFDVTIPGSFFSFL